MRILALITARGGSKRLPGKNLKLLGGKPMIVWSIDAAKNIGEICDILVSTDDPQIAAVSLAAGAQVPWLRPAELATDNASSVDVSLHALDWYEKNRGPVDGVLLLQPTSPFRTPRVICKGIELFHGNSLETILAVTRIHVHPKWVLKLEGQHLLPYATGSEPVPLNQDLPQVYIATGSLFLIAPAVLRSSRSFLGAKAIPLEIESPHEALDIDTEWDFKIAEMVANNLQEFPLIE